MYGERKREGYRLRIHRAGQQDDQIETLKSVGPYSAKIEAILMLVRLGVQGDKGDVNAFTEYWSVGHRKWIISDVLS
jgi:hypothetical protein